MLLSWDECETWLKDHDIDPLLVTGITLLPQETPRGGEYVVGRFETVAIRYNQPIAGKNSTATEIHGGPDEYFIDVNHRLLDYLPGAGRGLVSYQWLAYHGVIGCTKLHEVKIDASSRKMISTGEFNDLTEDERETYRDMFSDDFTKVTSGACVDFSQQQVDKIRQEFKQFDIDTGRSFIRA